MLGRERIEKAFNNQEVDRIPFGFWRHFVTGDDQFFGMKDENILERAVREHIDYYHKIKPDMMKIMSEGFFGYPPIMNNPLNNGDDLLKIKSIGKNHPWITKQVEHVKKISEAMKHDTAVFYNIFAPLQVIRIKFDFLDHEYDKFKILAENYPEELKIAGLEIQKDINELVQKLFDAQAIDGIYYCVQNIQSPIFNRDKYLKYIYPTEIEVLNNANVRNDFNILHICGYSNYKNDLKFYKDYIAKTYNWATHTENISLIEGKKVFNGQAVLGGFDNNADTVLTAGENTELVEFTKELIERNNFNGFILGADCSLPDNFDDNRLLLIKDLLEK
ncbi:uroporphyrinogen decarboxylase family protein [Tuanshanicoccus lijuaniae]|uniref:uroporphyrinogen decarboxylase family protein n=1 Tax=Aerococcaceae bacterium zg-1292 TaxID=2774330 RepID=UPI001BD817BE|nr:uroporphyrinogen decarboxylase [Aerococcaceae bacterium zg-A91]MBS4457129.1 uroporphyrinogen decarboxylase [Aerococcaceae bacterium zg-BR33]